MRDYLRASDLEHLPEEMVRLYDDGTEVGASILYFGDRLANEGAAPSRAISRPADVIGVEGVNRRDLRAVARAYDKGKSSGGETNAHRMVRAVLAKRHPEIARLDELALSHRIAQVIHMAVLAGYLCL
jgi:hypothetical protein